MAKKSDIRRQQGGMNDRGGRQQSQQPSRDTSRPHGGRQSSTSHRTQQR